MTSLLQSIVGIFIASGEVKAITQELYVELCEKDVSVCGKGWANCFDMKRERLPMEKEDLKDILTGRSLG